MLVTRKQYPNEEFNIWVDSKETEDALRNLFTSHRWNKNLKIVFKYIDSLDIPPYTRELVNFLIAHSLPSLAGDLLKPYVLARKDATNSLFRVYTQANLQLPKELLRYATGVPQQSRNKKTYPHAKPFLLFSRQVGIFPPNFHIMASCVLINVQSLEGEKLVQQMILYLDETLANPAIKLLMQILRQRAVDAKEKGNILSVCDILGTIGGIIPHLCRMSLLSYEKKGVAKNVIDIRQTNAPKHIGCASSWISSEEGAHEEPIMQKAFYMLFELIFYRIGNVPEELIELHFKVTRGVPLILEPNSPDSYSDTLYQRLIATALVAEHTPEEEAILNSLMQIPPPVVLASKGGALLLSAFTTVTSEGAPATSKKALPLSKEVEGNNLATTPSLSDA